MYSSKRRYSIDWYLYKFVEITRLQKKKNKIIKNNE